MKTAALQLLIILMATIEFASAAVYLPDEFTSVKFENTSSSQLVKATVVDGELMPVVDLPIVEVTAAPIHRYFVPARIESGTPVAIVNLPEVEVISFTNDLEAGSDEPIAVYELPEVEIIGTPLKDNFLKAIVEENGELLVYASLPEVNIESEYVTEIQVASLPEFKAYLYKSKETNTYSIYFTSKINELIAVAENAVECGETTAFNNMLGIKKNDRAFILQINHKRYLVPFTETNY